MFRKPKPRFEIGQLVILSISRPLVELYAGDQVSILETTRIGNDFRYRVGSANGRTGWVDEDWIREPLSATDRHA